MGKRSEIQDSWITTAMRETGGNLTAAARYINKVYSPETKVTRQNLQTWVNDIATGEELAEIMDSADANAKLRNARNSATALRRQIKNIEARYLEQVEINLATTEQVDGLPRPKVKFTPKPTNGRKITIEMLFSDLQIGKLMATYNSSVAEARVNEYIEVALDRIHQYELLGYSVEKIVFACLGDVIESDRKHGHQSARACDTGTPEQLRAAMELLIRIIESLCSVGVPVDVVCITGNHDWDGRGLFMYNPGREQLSWPLYHAVRRVTEAMGLNATFFIPEGAFHVHTIYNSKILYEHGVGVAAGYTQMKNHLAKRTDQLKDYITLFRMGDKHNISRFNNDRLVVNGAFFGDSRHAEEYSGIAGYDGEPAQLMFAHVHRDNDFRTTLFDSLAIQLGHIT